MILKAIWAASCNSYYVPGCDKQFPPWTSLGPGNNPQREEEAGIAVIHFTDEDVRPRITAGGGASGQPGGSALEPKFGKLAWPCP